MSITGSVFNYPKFKAFYPNSNIPLAGGLLNTYVGGSVNTPQVAYQDEACTVPWSNPIELDSNGEALIFFYPGESYKLVLTDSTGNASNGWTLDYQTGIAPPYIPPTSTFQKARGYRNAALTIPNTTNTKIPIDAVSFDASGIISLANGRIIPTQSGVYNVKGNLSTVTGNNQLAVFLYKNGSLYSNGTNISFTGGDGQGICVNVADDIPMNGTTDYIELWGYAASVGGLPLSVGNSASNFLSVVGPF